MSLVAYTTSSDEDSETEDNNELGSANAIVSNQVPSATSIELSTQQNGNSDDSISDEDTNDLTDTVPTLNLPQPHSTVKQLIVEEEDDEFLHKKVSSSLIQKPTPANLGSVKRPANRQPVKISIPSLSEFVDETTVKNIKIVGPMPNKPSGLLNMLPPPKLNLNFGKTSKQTDSVTKTTSLVPHSVSNRLKANPKLSTPQKPHKSTTNFAANSLLSSNYSNSDDSDESDAEDFFSFNNNDKLPEVSASEISAMVAAKAAKMAEFSNKLEQPEPSTAAQGAVNQENYETQSTSQTSRNEADIEALCGTRAAKRARKGEINFIDISQEEVVPRREDWLRNHLQASTEYQPRGCLVDDPGAGTRKKHQITYLAYQAKANEQELQAMWAANRHTRRQTQSKYGF